MLSTGCACMVGKNAQSRSNGEPRGDALIRRADARNDSMLLVGAAHDVIAERVAVFGAHEPIAEVVLLALCAAIAAHRHPARVDDRPTLFFLMADDGRQYA